MSRTSGGGTRRTCRRTRCSRNRRDERRDIPKQRQRHALALQLARDHHPIRLAQILRRTPHPPEQKPFKPRCSAPETAGCIYLLNCLQFCIALGRHFCNSAGRDRRRLAEGSYALMSHRTFDKIFFPLRMQKPWSESIKQVLKLAQDLTLEDRSHVKVLSPEKRPITLSRDVAGRPSSA